MTKTRFQTIVTTVYSTQPVRVWLAVLSLVTLLGSFEVVADSWMFDAHRVQQSQWWRPFTAWFSQLNIQHWFLNQWGVILMALLLPRRIGVVDLWSFAVIWLTSSVMLWFSDYQRYVGLSGVLYGLLVYAAAVSPFYSRWVRGLLVVGLSVKVLGENGWLPTLHSSWVAEFIQGDIAFESHFWGLLSGLGVIIARRFVQEYP